MKILILGGLGFIGSNLAEYLIKRGNKVSILSKSNSKIDNIIKFKHKVDKIFIKDLKDIGKEIKEFDIIFNCAGTVHNYHILDDPYIDLDCNCRNTIKLLEACKKYNPKVRIIYISTFFVNGNSYPLQEPLGLYGATKLAGEHICKAYSRVFGIDVVIARLTNIFGINEQFENPKKAAFNRLLKLAIENKEIPLYDNGKIKRNYLYVEDAVRALEIISRKGKTMQVYYVGNVKSFKLKEIFDIVIFEAGSGKIKNVDPPSFHKQVGMGSFECNITPLLELGWHPKYSLREGIKKTIEWTKTKIK